jgi:hypothetical protein
MGGNLLERNCIVDPDWTSRSALIEPEKLNKVAPLSVHEAAKCPDFWSNAEKVSDGVSHTVLRCH